MSPEGKSWSAVWQCLHMTEFQLIFLSPEENNTGKKLRFTHLDCLEVRGEGINAQEIGQKSCFAQLLTLVNFPPAIAAQRVCCCCCWVTSVVSDSVRPHRRQPTRLCRPWDSPGKNTGVGYHFLLQYMKGKSESEVTQSCPTLSDPVDCSLPGSSIHGIFQARVLEWDAIAFSELTC